MESRSGLGDGADGRCLEVQEEKHHAKKLEELVSSAKRQKLSSADDNDDHNDGARSARNAINQDKELQVHSSPPNLPDGNSLRFRASSFETASSNPGSSHRSTSSASWGPSDVGTPSNSAGEDLAAIRVLKIDSSSPSGDAGLIARNEYISKKYFPFSSSHIESQDQPSGSDPSLTKVVMAERVADPSNQSSSTTNGGPLPVGTVDLENVSSFTLQNGASSVSTLRNSSEVVPVASTSEIVTASVHLRRSLRGAEDKVGQFYSRTTLRPSRSCVYTQKYIRWIRWLTDPTFSDDNWGDKHFFRDGQARPFPQPDDFLQHHDSETDWYALFEAAVEPRWTQQEATRNRNDQMARTRRKRTPHPGNNRPREKMVRVGGEEKPISDCFPGETLAEKRMAASTFLSLPAEDQHDEDFQTFAAGAVMVKPAAPLVPEWKRDGDEVVPALRVDEDLAAVFPTPDFGPLKEGGRPPTSTGDQQSLDVPMTPPEVEDLEPHVQLPSREGCQDQPNAHQEQASPVVVKEETEADEEMSEVQLLLHGRGILQM